MKLDRTQFRHHESTVARRYDAEEFEGRTGQFKVVTPVDLRFLVYKDKTRYRLVGQVVTVLEQTCSRCLEPFRQDVDAAFDVRYLPHSENTGRDEREVEEDDLSDAFYRDDQIDLRQLMEEQFYLALPMKPLCREDCKGLCPNCGTDLNERTCQCEVRWEDPRLAGLKALMHRENDDA